MSEDRFNSCVQKISLRSNYTRLPSNYTNFPSIPSGYFCHQPPKHYLRSRLSGLFFPSVYAQSAVSSLVENDASSAVAGSGQMTSIERMSMAPSSKSLVSDEDIRKLIESEVPLDRLKRMYFKNARGEYSEDLQMILELTKNTAFIAFIFTSFLGGYAARDAYLRKNVHVQYETKFQAMRKYNDAIFFGSLRMGIKWGFKSALFTGLFMLTAQSIAVYRNQTNVIEYIAAGGLTCALLRADVGLRGIFAGGVIGAALGLLGGAGFCSLLYSTNETQQKRHYFQVQQKLREMREIEELLPTAELNNIENPAADELVVDRTVVTKQELVAA